VQATTTTLGRSTGIHLECRTHDNLREKGDRVARPETLPDWHLRCRCPSVPVMETADSLLCPGARELHQAAIRLAERRRLLIQSEMSSVVVIIASRIRAY
jgi:hypothetical protein